MCTDITSCSLARINTSSAVFNSDAQLRTKWNVPEMQKINGSLNRGLLKADLIRGSFIKKKV